MFVLVVWVDSLQQLANRIICFPLTVSDDVLVDKRLICFLRGLI